MPGDLRDRLRDSSAANGRSLNGEIVARLEETLAPSAGQAAAAHRHVPRLAAAATIAASVLLAALVGGVAGRGVAAELSTLRSSHAPLDAEHGPGLKGMLVGPATSSP
jgi:hypothetical protein